MRSARIFFAALIAILTAASAPSSALAGRGLPGSTDTAYGAHLFPQGELVDQALSLAGDLQMDWLAIDVPWSEYYPDPGAVPDWNQLDQIIRQAGRNQIAVMLSVTSPPAWALTGQGPEPEAAARWVLLLAQRYPETVQAIELFPGANIQENWGAAPDPAAYAGLFHTIYTQLDQADVPLWLILGGLQPVSPGQPGAMDDLVFLQGIYNSGIQGEFNIISVQFPEITGEPLSAPTREEQRVLRHHEQVRQVMLANQHESGLIWITRLSVPSGKLYPGDAQYRDALQQQAWLTEAYRHLRAQLSVGAVFFGSLNPAVSHNQPLNPSLILDETNYHPFYYTLRSLIAENSPGRLLSRYGRPKNGDFLKRMVIR